MSRPSPEQTAPSSRLWALALLSAALVLLFFFALEGLSAAYDRVAQQASVSNAASERALHSGSYATALAPWSAWRQRGYAWSLASAGQREAYDRHIALALRWAPADPYVWNMHASALIRLGDFGQETAHATRRTNELAGNVPPLQSQHAFLAVHYWPRANEALREEWLHSVEYMLARYRAHYLREILQRARAPHFCAYLGRAVEELGWCDQAAEATRACASPAALRPRQRRWCERMNLLP